MRINLNIICAVLMGVFLAVAMPYTLIRDQQELVKRYKVWRSSATTVAQVDSSEYMKHRKQMDTYRVRYTFSVNGKNYNNTDEMPSRYGPPSNMVKIKYNQEDPNLNTLEKTYRPPMLVLALITIGLAMPLGVICAFVYAITKKKFALHAVYVFGGIVLLTCVVHLTIWTQDLIGRLLNLY